MIKMINKMKMKLVNSQILNNFHRVNKYKTKNLIEQ